MGLVVQQVLVFCLVFCERGKWFWNIFDCSFNTYQIITSTKIACLRTQCLAALKDLHYFAYFIAEKLLKPMCTAQLNCFQALSSKHSTFTV